MDPEITVSEKPPFSSHSADLPGDCRLFFYCLCGHPVKYIGVGEKLEDLRKFDVQEYVDGLLEMKGEEDGYENADT